VKIRIQITKALPYRTFFTLQAAATQLVAGGMADGWRPARLPGLSACPSARPAGRAEQRGVCEHLTGRPGHTPR